MEFRIADTFTDSLGKLSNVEQTAAKTTAFDLQTDPSNPGLQFHRIDKTKDKNFWSIRVNKDIRIIVHKDDSSFLLCYVDHHDKAYDWAAKRKLEVHPQTGAAQLVEIRETVKEIVVPKYVEVEQPKRPLFESRTDDELLGYGIPKEWLDDVRNVRDEDALLKLVDHLPAEASDALLILADGGTPSVSETVFEATDPFAHPDAMRRFRVMNNVEELKLALEYPWDKWAIFLHPVQQELVEKNYSGPARVSGSAGTGKTIVAIHRAVHLARSNPDSRVLLTTFSNTLANALKKKLRLLISSEPRLAEQIDVHSMTSIGRRLYELKFSKPKIASRDEIREILSEVSATVEDHKFTVQFLLSEWEQVVDAWQLNTWVEYRDVARLGRKTRLPEKQRQLAWSVFELLRDQMAERSLMTDAALLAALAESLSARNNPPFDYAVVDEAQDINPSQLRFLAALGGDRPNSLFFAGDLGQRIFQQAFSWLSLGVDIRGRSRSLKINYRTSHQIRAQADRLLGPEVSDVDGITEDRRGTVSIFNGPSPEIIDFDSIEDEIGGVATWLGDLKKSGIQPHEIGIFVRSENEQPRATAAVERAGVMFKILDENVETTFGHISIGTMHLAKGLEFRAVAVMACDDEIIPSQARIEQVVDDADLEEIYNTERHLLYVACTRARDHLLVTAAENPSEFLDDLRL
ncbi:MAG: DEAD/DEAH box helicase [Chloracidobacterium sp.]|nr:DEAD/DEAH box helicase [Chloracidobacterium sp.]